MLMKTYEMITERRQPICGGKDPKKATISTVTTDDPVAYVRSLERKGDLEVSHNEDGDLVVTLESDGAKVRYTFTED